MNIDFLQQFGMAFLLGLFAALSACVYPLIPIITAVFGAREVKTWWQSFGLSSLYVAGMSLTYVALAIVTSLTSGIFGSYLGNTWVVASFGFFFLLLGLVFLDIIPMPFQRIGEKLQVQKSNSFLYPVIMGVLSGFIAAPCTAPLFGKIMIDIAQSRVDESASLLQPILLALSFSLGMGLPFMLVGGFSMRLPKPGKWMQAVKYLGSTVLFTAAWHYFEDLLPQTFPPSDKVLPFMISGIFIYITFLILAEPMKDKSEKSRKEKLVPTMFLLAASLGLFLVSSPFAKDRSALHHDKAGWLTSVADGKIKAKSNASHFVIIDFWAEWCTACVEMEHQLFSGTAFAEFVKQNNITLVRLDLTEEDSRYTKVAEKYNVMGLPTLIVTDADGNFIDSIIGFQNEKMSLKLLGYALKRKPFIPDKKPIKNE